MQSLYVLNQHTVSLSLFSLGRCYCKTKRKTNPFHLTPLCQGWMTTTQFWQRPLRSIEYCAGSQRTGRGRHKVRIVILSFVNIGLITTTEGRRDLSSPPTSPKYEDQAYTPEYSRENDKTASLASIPGESSKFFPSSQLECLLCQCIMT